MAIVRTLNYETKIRQVKDDAFQSALKAEAIRFGCSIEDVLPTRPVPPLSFDDTESRFTNIPEVVFPKLLEDLESIDVFHMTSVCKVWKESVYKHKQFLKKAEHSITRYLITRKEWFVVMCLGHMSPCEYECSFEILSWGLINWYCALSDNLQILVLDNIYAYAHVAQVLKSCPTLRFLHIGCARLTDAPFPCSPNPIQVYLPDLEIFICSSSDKFGLIELEGDILSSANDLQVFKGPLLWDHWFSLKQRYSLESQLSNLVALQLTTLSCEVLKELSDISHFTLKYFNIDYMEVDNVLNASDQHLGSARNNFDRLLSKMKTLEVLCVGSRPGVTKSTIETLIRFRIPLQCALLTEVRDHVLSDIQLYSENVNLDPVDTATVLAFENMLLDIEPAPCLSEFQFILSGDDIKTSLEQAGTGFQVETQEYLYFSLCSSYDLHYPPMRRRLNLFF